ncbi:MAG TPA: Rrf2 family transcriptional regulator [Bacillota bacterium]|nr:Rrf2 family transcriptional regulator [Bacillota bacterium]
MKLSTKGRYGLRAMIDLAVHSGDEHVALYSVAERQQISENYLEQVFSALRKAGLVKSVKGAQGGYSLADKPGNITIGTILRAMEGNFSIVDYNPDPKGREENSVQYCLQVNVWDKMTASLNALVDSITLEDMANDYKIKKGMMKLMYYI